MWGRRGAGCSQFCAYITIGISVWRCLFLIFILLHSNLLCCLSCCHFSLANMAAILNLKMADLSWDRKLRLKIYNLVRLIIRILKMYSLLFV